MKEGQNIGSPPLLNGSNYVYWKAMMKVYLQSIGEKAWRSIVKGWSPPERTVGGTTVRKLESEWTATDENNAIGNSKALYAIFSAVDERIYKLIYNSKSAKEAWEILEISFEGTNKVKLSRLQMLTTRFEKLKMKDEERIIDFNARLMDIANESAFLGEVMSNDKLVGKVLRSLPSRYDSKVYAIEEAYDIVTLPLQELLGILQVHEMTLNGKVDAVVNQENQIRGKVCKDYGQNNLVALTVVGEPTADSTDNSADASLCSSDIESDEEPSKEEIFQKFTKQFKKWKKVVTRLTLQVNSLEASLTDEKEQHTTTKTELERQRKFNSMLSKKLSAKKEIADESVEVATPEKLTVLKEEPKHKPTEVPKHEKMKTKDTRTCYSCNKKGHIQKNCDDRKYPDANPKFGERKHVVRQHKARNYRKHESVYRIDFREPQHICRRLYREPEPVQYPLQQRRNQSRFIPYQHQIKSKVCYYCKKKGHIRRNCSDFLAFQRVRRYDQQTNMVWRVKEKKECHTLESELEVNPTAPAEDSGTSSDAATTIGCHNMHTSEMHTCTTLGGAKTDIQGEKKSDSYCRLVEKSQMQKLLQGVLNGRLDDLLTKRGRASSSSVVLPKNVKGEIVVPLKTVMTQFWTATTLIDKSASVESSVGGSTGRYQ